MSERKNDMQKRLKNASSFLDVVDVLRDYYEMDAPLGMISKGIIIHQFPRLVKKVGIKEKPEWQRAKEV